MAHVYTHSLYLFYASFAFTLQIVVVLWLSIAIKAPLFYPALKRIREKVLLIHIINL